MALRKLPVFFCAECGNPDYRTMPNKIFCSPTCRQRQWNRRITGGFKLYELAMQWRIDRPKNALADMTVVADQLASDERIIRSRRAKVIAKHKAEGIDGELPPDFEPGENKSQSVSLSVPQQRAICDAGLFALACAANRPPNDPDQRPEGWHPDKISALRNAVINLGGTVREEELTDA